MDKRERAFPGSFRAAHDQYGMTLRNWFAGQFFGAVLIDADTYEGAALRAYEAADAMLAQRTKES